MKTVVVAAGVLVENGKVLLTQRKAGAHLEGLWEFPGGKVEAGEDPRAALARELKEEVDLDVSVGDAVDVTFHRYEEVEKAVLLLFFEVTRKPGSGDPKAVDVAALRWTAHGELDALTFPAADVAIVRRVKTLLRDA
ncbi:MAG: (deoxy)nucleoside triphosphate pyrophosphohydrolase [Polyangiaceae bacterium]